MKTFTTGTGAVVCTTYSGQVYRVEHRFAKCYTVAEEIRDAFIDVFDGSFDECMQYVREWDEIEQDPRNFG